MIEAKEGRKVVTVDVPGAFMQAEMDDEVFMKIEGPLGPHLCGVR